MDKTCYMTCELKVDTKSSGWHKTITKILDRIKEVTYTIDAQTGIASISGRVNPKTLLKLLEKAGKHAQIIKVESGASQPYEPPVEDEEEENFPQFHYGYNPTTPMPLPAPVPVGQPYYYEDPPPCSIM